MLKPSRYNKFVDLPSGRLLAFNGATAALAEIDEETLPKFLRLLATRGAQVFQSDAELLGQMQYARFLCPDELDEVEEQRRRNEEQKQSRSTFFLTIAPTLACNFRCDYCFQHAGSAVMSPDTVQALLRFCERNLPGTEHLMLTWFGGEPTLCSDRVIELQEQLVQMAQRQQLKETSASIISNGYLLDADMAKRFSEVGITEAQITIDGPPEIHDQRRKLASGRGTFDRILANLHESSRFLRVVVRINVDEDNSSAALRVVDLLEEQKLLPSVNIYFAPVNPAKGVCADAGGRCLSTQRFARLQVELYRELVSRGHRRIEYPMIAPGGYCGAGTENSYVVAPNGLLFKCWEELSLNPAEAVGDIYGTERSSVQEANLARYRKYDAFGKGGCRECSILPLCLGGCPNAALASENDHNGYCSPWKYNLGEMLTLRYLCNNQEEVTG
jgi:uncharacterized protein